VHRAHLLPRSNTLSSRLSRLPLRLVVTRRNTAVLHRGLSVTWSCYGLLLLLLRLRSRRQRGQWLLSTHGPLSHLLHLRPSRPSHLHLRPHLLPHHGMLIHRRIPLRVTAGIRRQPIRALRQRLTRSGRQLLVALLPLAAAHVAWPRARRRHNGAVLDHVLHDAGSQFLRVLAHF
jgi:hypothetical protein